MPFLWCVLTRRGGPGRAIIREKLKSVSPRMASFRASVAFTELGAADPIEQIGVS